jgi:hypothetical protein
MLKSNRSRKANKKDMRIIAAFRPRIMRRRFCKTQNPSKKFPEDCLFDTYGKSSHIKYFSRDLLRKESLKNRILTPGFS